MPPKTTVRCSCGGRGFGNNPSEICPCPKCGNSGQRPITTEDLRGCWDKAYQQFMNTGYFSKEDSEKFLEQYLKTRYGIEEEK